MTTEQEDHRSRRHVWRRLSETQARLDALLAAVGPLLDHAVEHEELCSDLAAGYSCWIHNAAEATRAAIKAAKTVVPVLQLDVIAALQQADEEEPT